MTQPASAPSRSFRFVVINDMHYTTPEDGPWLEAAVRKINSVLDLEFALVLGDLAENGTREELTAAKNILEQLRVPYYPVPGNHDLPPETPPNAPNGGLSTYDQLFPNRRNYTFNHAGWQFVALDSTAGSAYENVLLNAHARSFAQHAARTLDRRSPTILFTHFPLALDVQYHLADGLDLLTLLSPLNLRIVFSGHFHGVTQSTFCQIPLLTARGISRVREIHDGGTAKGYYITTANPDGTVQFEYVEFSASAQPAQESPAH